MTARSSSKSRARVRRSTAKSRRQTEPAPLTLRLRDLVGILLAGAMVTSLGVTIVKMRFEARDYEIEAARLQEMTSLRRDEVKRLEARLGLMHRDEVLRETAIEDLGMIDPETSSVEKLALDETRETAYREAQHQARQQLESKRQQLVAWQKEVF